MGSQIGGGLTPQLKLSNRGSRRKIGKEKGPVEVGVDKKIILNRKADESTIKMDEVKKGKVKTQKDKLRKLRGK